MIQTDISSIRYAGNASIVTPYPVPFCFFNDEDLVVAIRDASLIEETLVLGTDYTVTGEGNPEGGNILTTWAVPASTSLTIVRQVPATQLASYEEGDAFPAKSHERALDKLTMLAQQAQRQMGDGTGESSDQGNAFRLTTASGGIRSLPKVLNSTAGIDAGGNAVLRTAEQLLQSLGVVASTWADAATRLTSVAIFKGQLGVQLDNLTIWVANSTGAGDWLPHPRENGVVISQNGVTTAKPNPSGDIVGTAESQVLLNKTLQSPSVIAPTGLVRGDVGLPAVNNTSDADKPVSTATAAALSSKQETFQKGMPGGYAPLDGGGKVPVEYMPSSLLGASTYKGTWNASTNTPTITTGSADEDNVAFRYVVAVAGTTNVDGVATWNVGDQIISNGTVWQRVASTAAVNSVAGKTGTVTLDKGDVGLGQVDDTSDATKNSAAATLTNKVISGLSNTLDVRLNTGDVSGNLPTSRLNGGTGAAPDTWWCGDGSWKKPPGSGDVAGPVISVDGDFAVFDGTTGKLVKSMARNSVGDVFGPASAVDAEFAVYSGTSGKVLGRLARSQLREYRLPRNYITGLNCTNNAADSVNDVDVAAGECRDITNTDDIVLASSITKRIDAAWTVGTNQGGLDAGAVGTNNATYHVFVIKNPSTGVVDVLFSASISAPVMPSGFTLRRRVHSLIWKTSGGIFEWHSLENNYVEYNSPNIIYSNQAWGNQTSLIASGCPTGRRFLGHVALFGYSNSATSAGWFSLKDPLAASSSHGIFLGYNHWDANIFMVPSDSQGRFSATSAMSVGSSQNIYLYTLGYWDDRDQNGI